jgi:hypothetical protein
VAICWPGFVRSPGKEEQSKQDEGRDGEGHDDGSGLLFSSGRSGVGLIGGCLSLGGYSLCGDGFGCSCSGGDVEGLLGCGAASGDEPGRGR